MQKIFLCGLLILKSKKQIVKNMIKPVLTTSIAKKTLLGTALLGSVYYNADSQNKLPTADSNRQKTEILSKDASSALKSQILMNTIHILPDGNMVEYNSAGKIVKEYIYADKSLYSYHTYKYNNDGTLNLEAEYSADGNCVWARSYFYKQGEIISDLTIDEDVIWVRYFDKEGYITESVVKDINGKEILRYVYGQDDSGNRTEKIYDAEGKLISDD